MRFQQSQICALEVQTPGAANADDFPSAILQRLDASSNADGVVLDFVFGGVIALLVRFDGTLDFKGVEFVFGALITGVVVFAHMLGIAERHIKQPHQLIQVHNELVAS